MKRIEAANTGQRFYDCKPCRKDGDKRRYVASGHCVTCSRTRSAVQAKKISAAIQAGKAA